MTKLCVGRRVHCILYGGKDGTIIRVHGTPAPETVQQLAGGAVVMGGRADVDVTWDDGTESRRVPESIVMGCQWQLYDEVRSRDDVLRAIHHAEQTEAKLRDEEAARAEQHAHDKAEAIAELQREYPWAKADDGKTTPWARAASNLRRELKLAFPGVKFAVRSKSYSMGNSISVHWTLGPTTKEVEAVAGKYQGGHFDGMEDIYENDHSAMGEAVDIVLGQAKYVSCSREIGDEAREIVGRSLCEAQRVEYAGPNTRYVYGAGDANCLQDHLWRLFGKASIPPGATIAGVEHGEDGYQVRYENNPPPDGKELRRGNTLRDSC